MMIYVLVAVGRNEREIMPAFLIIIETWDQKFIAVTICRGWFFRLSDFATRRLRFIHAKFLCSLFVWWHGKINKDYFSHVKFFLIVDFDEFQFGPNFKKTPIHSLIDVESDDVLTGLM